MVRRVTSKCVLAITQVLLRIRLLRFLEVYSELTITDSLLLCSHYLSDSCTVVVFIFGNLQCKNLTFQGLQLILQIAAHKLERGAGLSDRKLVIVIQPIEKFVDIADLHLDSQSRRAHIYIRDVILLDECLL